MPEKIEEQPVITDDEFFHISRVLEDKHAIFYKLWEMGKPVFTDIIPTAAIRWDEDFERAIFEWNPDFWKELSKDEYTKTFVFSASV